MGKNIAIILLAVLLVVSGGILIFFIYSVNDLGLRLDEKTNLLEQTTVELAQQKAELTATMTELAEHKTELSNVRNDLAQTTNELTQNQAEVTRYKAQVSSLTKAAEDNKFYFYYEETKQRFGIYNLDSFLKRYVELKEYEADVFDCSQMSAVVERELENTGFHTIMVAGMTPGNPETQHAWLLVEVDEGEYMPVEATIPTVVWWEYDYFNEYFTYDYVFETIQEALDFNAAEFNWWEELNK